MFVALMSLSMCRTSGETGGPWSSPPSADRVPSAMTAVRGVLVALVTKAGADERQFLVAHTGLPEVLLDAAVPPLQLREDAEHRLGPRLRDPPQPLELLLGLRGLEPPLVAHTQPLLAARELCGDRL